MSPLRLTIVVLALIVISILAGYAAKILLPSIGGLTFYVVLAVGGFLLYTQYKRRKAFAPIFGRTIWTLEGKLNQRHERVGHGTDIRVVPYFGKHRVVLPPQWLKSHSWDELSVLGGKDNIKAEGYCRDAQPVEGQSEFYLVRLGSLSI